MLFGVSLTVGLDEVGNCEHKREQNTQGEE
jgi:hypothetical protein